MGSPFSKKTIPEPGQVWEAPSGISLQAWGEDPLKLSYEPILGKNLKCQSGRSPMTGAQYKHWGLFLMARPLVKQKDVEGVTQNFARYLQPPQPS